MACFTNTFKELAGNFIDILLSKKNSKFFGSNKKVLKSPNKNA